jgi:hypothetical protein
VVEVVRMQTTAQEQRVLAVLAVAVKALVVHQEELHQ